MSLSEALEAPVPPAEGMIPPPDQIRTLIDQNVRETRWLRRLLRLSKDHQRLRRRLQGSGCDPREVTRG